MPEVGGTPPQRSGSDASDESGTEDPGRGLGTIEMLPDPSGVPVVRLCGEIDISNAAEIGAELERIVGTGTRRLVVDMSALEFMDSSGIAMLLHAAARVDSIAVRRPSAVVRRIIEATGLEATLPIEADPPRPVPPQRSDPARLPPGAPGYSAHYACHARRVEENEMGMIRKTLSVGTLGTVSFRSKKEKLRRAERARRHAETSLEAEHEARVSAESRIDAAEKRVKHARAAAAVAAAQLERNRRKRKRDKKDRKAETAAALGELRANVEPVVRSGVKSARRAGADASKRGRKAGRRARKAAEKSLGSARASATAAASAATDAAREAVKQASTRD